MSDATFDALLPYLNRSDALNDNSALTKSHEAGNTLWVADENLLQVIGQIASPAKLQGLPPKLQGLPPKLQVLTNRYDVFQHCQTKKLPAQFSDYDFRGFADSSLSCIVYRISKEKPVVHHIINESFRVLRKGGTLVMAGEKSDGAKTYIDKASKLLDRKTLARKLGNSYLGIIHKNKDYEPTQRLDDRDYPMLRPIFELNDCDVLSKPGLFGWDKQDQGSALLIHSAEQFLQQPEQTQKPPRSLLDLGCGYGYLTLHSRHWPSIITRAATDNNAAAVCCTRINAEAHGLAVTVSADDCGAHIKSQFDLIVCNPPFHQGFSVDSSLTDKFLRNSHQRLNPQGTALFVVNQFIGLEKKAVGIFSKVEQLGSDGQFKVLALRK